ncbi:MAG: DNA polymerase III subunit beta, partial [Oscillospiraceae bacterium]|nr:DNA polymerase III subunit beta [Oscillospiraceae bacterium]
RKLPDDMVAISAEAENDMCSITCGMSQFQILGMPAEDFPDLPTMDSIHSFSIPEREIKSIIAQTLFAVSSDETRPVHLGSLFEMDETGLTVVSVDGFRMALRRTPVKDQKEMEKFSFVVPGASLAEVEKIASERENPAIITEGARHVQFQMGDTVLISRRLEGEFLNYRQAIVRNNSIVLYANPKDLLSSIERVSLIISEKLKSPLRCIFGENVLSIRTTTALGKASDECAVEGDGKQLEIGFNNRYLMDALKAVPAQRVRLELGTSISPCLILPEEEGDESFLYMVLPVRLKAGV